MPSFHLQYLMVLALSVTAAVTSPITTPAAPVRVSDNATAPATPPDTEAGHPYVILLTDNQGRYKPMVFTRVFDSDITCQASLGNINDLLKYIVNPVGEAPTLQGVDQSLAAAVYQIVVGYTEQNHHAPDISLSCVPNAPGLIPPDATREPTQP